jgi:hypothetical protein
MVIEQSRAGVEGRVPIGVVVRGDAVRNDRREELALYTSDRVATRDELDHLRRRESHTSKSVLV